MKRAYFQKLEKYNCSSPLELKNVIEQLAFNEHGLIPVITQDVTSKAILMLAWMNKESLCQTIETGRMTYWSRSQEQLWVKGQTSGHTQTLISMFFDCDGDAILCQVNQMGAACHTNRPGCFYLHVDIEKKQVRVSTDNNDSLNEQ